MRDSKGMCLARLTRVDPAEFYADQLVTFSGWRDAVCAVLTCFGGRAIPSVSGRQEDRLFPYLG